MNKRRKCFVGHKHNQMDTCSIFWKWKTMKIDFSKYQDFKSIDNPYDWDDETPYKKKYNGNGYKLKQGFRFVGTPDEEKHRWYNGGWSSEYNQALNYLLDLGLIEIVYDELEEEG
jgi:hypothetical protein